MNYDDKEESAPKAKRPASEWLSDIQRAQSRREKFIKEGEHIESVYRSENQIADAWGGNGNPYSGSTFNILYSNTKILQPAVFFRIPKPIVRPQFISNRAEDNSPASAAAKVLQKALEQTLDAYDFKGLMKEVVKDSLLPGEGLAYVEYHPDIDENDEIKYENARCCYASWKDVVFGFAKRWEEVPWVAIRFYMDREELKSKFGAKGAKCGLNKPVETSSRVIDQDHENDCAEVWKIFEKKTGMVYFVSDGCRDGFLKYEPMPIKLQAKIPMPKPLRFIETTSDFLPVPLYRQYATQANQLEVVSKRIVMLTKALKYRGVYDSRLSEMRNVFDADDNEFVPAENAVAFENGLERGIWEAPINKLASVLAELKKQEQGIIQTIYEITGISDIMRGRSDAIETARAQEIKSNFGTLTLQEMQDEVQRFIADIVKMKAEIIAENFSVETLKQMTGLNYPTEQEKQTVMSLSQNPEVLQSIGITSEMAQDIMSKPTWEQIKTILSSDVLRQLAVDIETDSTLHREMAEDKADITELLSGVMDYFERASMAVQSGIMPLDAAKALLMSAVRRFRLGTEVEESLEKIGLQPAQPQQPQRPTPEEIEAQKQQQQMMADFQKMQQEMQKMQAELAADRERHQMEMATIKAKSEAEVAKQQAQMQDKLITGMN